MLMGVQCHDSFPYAPTRSKTKFIVLYTLTDPAPVLSSEIVKYFLQYTNLNLNSFESRIKCYSNELLSKFKTTIQGVSYS